MNAFVCNYAPVRFLPYRETGEFINVGVAVCCPEIDWFDFRLELRKTKRAHGFFPEMDKTILKRSLRAIELELARVRNAGELQLYGTRLTPKEAAHRTLWFKELIRPRESLLHFGEPGVMLAADPRGTLEELFNDLVERHFAQPGEYQEKQMGRRLGELLLEWRLPYEKDKPVGDDEFHVKMPFVHAVNGKTIKALKPFDLDKPDTNEIYNHGDTWIAKLRRLADRKCLPADVVFATRMPDKNRRRKAATVICDTLKEMKVRIVDFNQSEQLREAAQLA